MEKLKEFIEGRFRYCQQAGDTKTKQVFFYQAFGALDYYSFEHPGNDDELYTLWAEWTEKFTQEIFGKGGLTNAPIHAIMSSSKERN